MRCCRMEDNYANFIFYITENEALNSSGNTLEVQVVPSSINEHIESFSTEKANFDIADDRQAQSEKVEGYYFYSYHWNLKFSFYKCGCKFFFFYRFKTVFFT